MTDASVRRRPVGIGPVLAVMVIALLVLFDREWRKGEVFSPADLVFTLYPWAHDAPKTSPQNPTRSDEAFFHQPLMATHFDRLRAGEWPDYDETRLGGVPAFFQGLDVGRALSPFSLPFYLQPADRAVNWYGPLRLLAAALFMALFLREIGASPWAAAIGGVAFGLNGHFMEWLSAPMPTVAAWTPLVLRQVRRCVRRAGWLDAAGLALSLGALLLGGYLATALACLFGIGVYALVELVASRRVDSNAPALPRACAALGVGGVLGLCVGAGAMVPMVASLVDSPAASRIVSPDGAEWPNLVTLALPDFWGTPSQSIWWNPHPEANYPEHVVYFGIVTLLLAGAAAVAALPRELSRVRWTSAALVLAAFTRAYGAPPGTWLLWLPGQLQSNPFRWYALAACGLAVLAGIGAHALLASEERRHRLRAWVGVTATALTLVAITGASFFVNLAQIRALNLQEYERPQIRRFVAIVVATLLVSGLTALITNARRRTVLGVVLAALVAGDLVQQYHRFNPTLPRDQYYPTTAGIDWLREHAAGTRIAPVDGTSELVQGHVWSLFGIEAITGYDFHGDREYQRFIRIAQGPPGALVPDAAPVWHYVGVRRDTLDLRMLGVLGTTYLVASPVDSTPRVGGYSTLKPFSDGRHLSFTFPVRHDGLRRLDLFVATHRRTNTGRWRWTLADDAGVTVASGVIEQGALRDNDWWPLDFPPVEQSAGRRFTLDVHGQGGGYMDSATFWLTAAPSPLDTTLIVDGQPDARALWFRTFTTAPDRFDGAELVRAGDLNIYRNPWARPRAWFVERVHVADADAHAPAMHASSFDPAREAWFDRPAQWTSPARVVRYARADDARTFEVEAPEGGALVVSERAHAGWHVEIDGRPVPWHVADGILIGVNVPPGSRVVSLTYRQPWTRTAVALSLVSTFGIAFACWGSVMRARR